MNKALLIGLIAVVAAAMFGGFMAVGGPGYARLEKQDSQRAQDLKDLYRYLLCRAKDQSLPQILDAETHCAEFIKLSELVDPTSGDPYEYRRLNDTSFELCATFATKAQKGNRGYYARQLRFDGQVGCRVGTVDVVNR